MYNGGLRAGLWRGNFELLTHLFCRKPLALSVGLSLSCYTSLYLFYRPGIIFRVQTGTEAGGLLSKQVFHGAMLTCMIASVCLFVRRSRFFYTRSTMAVRGNGRMVSRLLVW